MREEIADRVPIFHNSILYPTKAHEKKVQDNIIYAILTVPWSDLLSNYLQIWAMLIMQKILFIRICILNLTRHFDHQRLVRESESDGFACFPIGRHGEESKLIGRRRSSAFKVCTALVTSILTIHFVHIKCCTSHHITSSICVLHSVIQSDLMVGLFLLNNADEGSNLAQSDLHKTIGGDWSAGCSTCLKCMQRSSFLSGNRGIWVKSYWEVPAHENREKHVEESVSEWKSNQIVISEHKMAGGLLSVWIECLEVSPLTNQFPFVSASTLRTRIRIPRF